MAVFFNFVFLSTWAIAATTFPHNIVTNFLKGSRVDFESSGSGPDQLVQGMVKVVRLDPNLVARSGLPRRGRGPSHGSRTFPAFLTRARAGPALAPKASLSPLRHLQAENPAGPDPRKKQRLHMWQTAVSKGDHGKMGMSLPISLKDAAKQTCAAVPFTQRVTTEGCDAVTVHNKLCYGQCSSLFVPSAGEPGAAARHHRAPCSRCAPSRSRVVAVPLRCGAEGVQERRVMVVEECKCETGREEESSYGAVAAGRS